MLEVHICRNNNLCSLFMNTGLTAKQSAAAQGGRMETLQCHCSAELSSGGFSPTGAAY